MSRLRSIKSDDEASRNTRTQGECHEYKSVMYGSEREFFILYVHHSIADDDEEILKRNELAAEVIGGFV